jgi:glycosyltransferase involved in cell wall biosynthesis
MKPLIIYFYHNRPVKEAYNEWENGKHPGHILYGITEFDKYNVKSIFHKFSGKKNRLILALFNAKQIIGRKNKYDILYASHSLGLELVLLLKSIGMYNKPIVLWQHRIVHFNKKKSVNYFHKIFYRGVNKLLFFTPLHVRESVRTGNVSISKCSVIKWGPDIDFYDKIVKENGIKRSGVHISSGKENRDFTTLIRAFSQSVAKLDIYTPKTNGNINYIREFESFEKIPENISINLVSGIIPYELAIKVANSYTVVICCTEQNYTVGLTTLVEALALGKPIITSDNPYFEIDVDKHECGIKIPYGDIEGWKSAIEYLENNKERAFEMGINGRKLAEKEYNLQSFAKEIVKIFYDVIRTRHQK